MKNDCEIVRDLLPAYMEHLCSDASNEYIEEHMAVCGECKKLMEEAMQDGPSQKPHTALPDAEKILRKASWKLHSKAILCSVGITAIVLFWLVYLWAKLFADQGDYRYFSWSFWEVFSSGSLLFPILTAVWMIVLVIHSIRKKTWKKNLVLGVILMLLTAAQFGYLEKRSQIVSVNSWTTVESIPDEYHIVIASGDGSTAATLETNPTVTRLVKTDGTIYGFSYECTRDHPNEGILLGVWNTED